MSVSVSGMNEASKYVFNGAIYTAASAWAASHLLEASPVGVLWGLSNVSAGAIFGATSYVVEVLARKGLEGMFPLGDAQATKTTRLVTCLATTILGMVGGFFALKAIGITLTASVVVNLTLSLFMRGLIVHGVVRCFCGDTDKQPVGPVPPAPAAPPAYV